MAGESTIWAVRPADPTAGICRRRGLLPGQGIGQDSLGKIVADGDVVRSFPDFLRQILLSYDLFVDPIRISSALASPPGNLSSREIALGFFSEPVK
jgi:hypothetical protein